MPERLPSGVAVLGVVSLLTAVSSAMILGLLPVFLVVVLGAQMTAVGFIEGVAGAAMALAKVVSGPFSDWLGRRKPVLVVGYGLSALIKTVLPVAEFASTVLVVRGIDRVGKGVRDAPRDALLSDITPPSIRGSGFGLRAALYTAGFVLGPLAATALMLWSGDDYRLVFWVAIVPAAAAIALLVLGVTEPPKAPTGAGRRRLSRKSLTGLSRLYWVIVAIAAVFSLARFSQAFLVLKAHDIGIAAAYLPMVMVVMHVTYSLSAYPCGVLADRVSPQRQLGLAGLVLAGADLVLALADTAWLIGLGSALWGLQMGLSYGLLKAAVADVAPEDLRGTAFGVYDCVIGITTFLASVLAGWAWSMGGAGLTFGLGVALALAAIVAVGSSSYTLKRGSR
ncbi:MAG: MFS transporter [Hyphomicrobiales bacterium]|nr:MFS transporter [Hyphomicrobiales bacterium]